MNEKDGMKKCCVLLHFFSASSRERWARMEKSVRKVALLAVGALRRPRSLGQRPLQEKKKKKRTRWDVGFRCYSLFKRRAGHDA